MNKFNNMNKFPSRILSSARDFLASIAVCGAAIAPAHMEAAAPSVLAEFPSDSVVNYHGFPLGADVGWLTELEAGGEKFFDSEGNQADCMRLLKEECGVNAIRLRVWVNPEGGWNGKEDVLLKSRRAQQLNLPLMIDFHFSDS